MQQTEPAKNDPWWAWKEIESFADDNLKMILQSVRMHVHRRAPGLEPDNELERTIVAGHSTEGVQVVLGLVDKWIDRKHLGQ